jgi:hypothetical protein
LRIESAENDGSAVVESKPTMDQIPGIEEKDLGTENSEPKTIPKAQGRKVVQGMTEVFER